MSVIFISYSHKDVAFVQSLYSKLIQLAFDVWVDWEKVESVSNWQQSVQQGIQLADLCLLIISPNFLASYGCALETEYIIATRKSILLILLCRKLPMPNVLIDHKLVHIENINSTDEYMPQLFEVISQQLRVRV